MNAFKFNDKFGFDPPFEFLDNVELEYDEQLDATLNTIEKIKVRKQIRFLSKSSYESKYEGNYIRPDNENMFVIFAQKRRGTTVSLGAVSKLRLSGVTHYDITDIFGISLGKNLIREIEKDSNYARNIVFDFLKWAEVKKGDKYTLWTEVLLSRISSYIKEYPSDYVYEPPTQFEKLFSLFQLYVELGIIDLSNTAEYLSTEVFFALARSIRSKKLTEERWNPYVSFLKHEPNTPDDAKYNPLFSSLSDLEQNTKSFFDKIKFISNQKSNEKATALTIEIEENIFGILYDIFKWFKDELVDALRVRTKELSGDVKKLERLYNAYVVGHINGILDLAASIVEALGLIIGLLSFTILDTVVESVKDFINKLDWATFYKMIKDGLKKLFNFIDGDDIYKNTYEFGVFKIKVLEIALDFVTIVKGTAKGATKLVTITKNFPDYLRNINKAIKDFELLIDIKGLSKKLVNDVNAKGITIELEFIYKNSQFNSGIPIKIPDGKIIRVKYDGIELKNFTKDKDATDYIKKLNNDKNFLNKEADKAFKELVEDIIRTNKSSVKIKDLDEFRNKRNLPEYNLKDGSTGTTAKIEIGDESYHGINSSFAPNTLELRRKWFNKIKWVPPKKTQPKHLGHAQSLSHAEAHSLMNAYEKLGKLPSRLIMYVDRPTCNMCKGELPALMKALGIDELIIFSGTNKNPITLTINF